MALSPAEQQYELTRDRIRDGELPFLKATFEGDGWLKVFGGTETYLLMACYYRQSSVIEFLLNKVEENKHRVEVQQWLQVVSPNEYTPLHNYLCVSSLVYRSKKRHAGLPVLTHILQKIINTGFDVNQRNSYGETPLFLAVVNNDVFSVERLLRLGADPNAKCCVLMDTPLHQACLSVSQDIIKPLLASSKINVDLQNGNGMTALLIAAQRGDTSKVTQLLDQGANIHILSNRGDSILSMSVQTTKVDSSGKTCFEAVTEILETILDQESVHKILMLRNNRNESLLRTAVRYKNLPALVKLLGTYNEIFDVNERDTEGKSLLHFSVLENPDRDIMICLMESGVDVNCKDNHGNTPLVYFFKTSRSRRHEPVDAPNSNV